MLQVFLGPLSSPKIYESGPYASTSQLELGTAVSLPVLQGLVSAQTLMHAAEGNFSPSILHLVPDYESTIA